MNGKKNNEVDIAKFIELKLNGIQVLEEENINDREKRLIAQLNLLKIENP